ncbi:fungal-specific transcription factor domain-containing protein [Aspergillus multicolor]|uniref:Zn(II)2Cys6 transcription factor n=1 Tax=Aspergillus multicolor TaxID=41759 RepID=UPI003CCCA9AE
MDQPASSLPPRQRRRRPVHKSFSGCAKCKARKIKCDETKPSCTRCRERGLTCPGVAPGPKIRWSTKHERQQAEDTSPARGDRSLLSIVKPAEARLLASPREGLHVDLGKDPVGDIALGEIAELTPSQLTAILRNEPLEVSDMCLQDSDSGAFSEFLPSSLFSDPFQLMSFDLEDTPADFSSPNSLMPHQESSPGLIYPALFDSETELVGAYFSIVCPIFSTFDSEQNLFRSFVKSKWQSSISMFYAILSMSAAKLAWRNPDLKAQALKYQALSLASLYSDNDCSGVPSGGWTAELLFVVLMLGLSTCWHNMKDLGIVHLKVMQHAIIEPAVQQTCGPGILAFFRNAVVYWEMVVCSVNDEVAVQDHSAVVRRPRRPNPPPQPRRYRIMPHPWTGVASKPQELFARVAHHIRQVRPFSSGSSLAADSFLSSLDRLEKEIWSLELPRLHEIANTGDQNTPAIHHLLLAEAYLFATLYQLYYVFPSRRQRRGEWIGESLPTRAANSWAEQQARSWFVTDDQWVNFLGRNIIMRIEQIQLTSGTSCVHSLLLLVGSGSLGLDLNTQDDDEREQEQERAEVLRTRQFVLDRLTRISESILSEPVCQVKLVVMEIFKRLDLGVDVFWMDILHSMGAVTVIG